MKGKPLVLRLFLEGIEVPVVSATITSIPDTPLQASIQIPPIAQVKDLIERTLVHVFYYDPRPEDIGNERDSYKLLFVGELVGIRGVKHILNYSIILSCLGTSVYWDTTYLFNATGLGKKGRRLASFVGANTSVVSSSGATSIFPENTTGFSKLAKIINSRPASFSNMKGMLGGIVHLLERVGGFYRGDRVYKGFNDFTSLGELRLKLMQQVHAASGDNSSALLFRRPTLKKWVKNTIASKGSMESFNVVAKKLMQLIFHQRQSIPAPPYFEGSEEKKQKKVWSSKGLSAAAAVGKIRRDVSGLNAGNLTVTGVRTEMRKARGVYSRAERVCGEQAKKNAAAGGVKTNVAKFQRALSLFDAAGDIIKKGLAVYENQAKLQRSVVYLGGAALAAGVLEAAKKSFARALAKANKALGILGATRGSSSMKTYIDRKYERLGIHVFKPDLFFAAPPVCNVLFPDMYDHFEWSRNFMAEPTRLMLRGGSKRSSDIFGGSSKYGVIFAPDTPSVRGSVKLSSEKFATQILDHELYSGIIPAQVQIPWSKIYKIDIKGAPTKYSFLQRLANFEYAKRHFASRTASVTGRFNPYFIPGFPALVVDKPMAGWELVLYQEIEKVGGGADAKTRAGILNQVVAPQYLCFCQQLTHNLTQEGGATQYGMVMVRDHRETADKLGFNTVETYTRYRSKTRSHLVLLDPAVNETSDIRVGPKGGKVISQKYAGEARIGRTYWVPSGAAGRLKAPIESWRRHTWTTAEARKRVEIAGLMSQAAQPKAYLLHEQESVVKKKVTKDYGIEYALTPPWMARCWHLPEIGKTYNEMFACNSIADGIGVFADADLAAAYRRDKSFRDQTRKELTSSPFDDDKPVSNKDVDTFDYSAFDDDEPANPFWD